MSISSIISIANSGLSVAQTRISLASTNISNAETTGYTAKTADVTTRTVGGVGTGVQVIGTGSDVDEKLHESLVSAISTASYDATIASYLETISAALGTTDDGGDLTNALSDLQTALSDAIADPADTSAADALTEALATWASSVNDITDSIQSVRTSADQSISESVESVNDLLNQIDDLNDQITKATANGTSTSDLEDQRRAALEELGQYMDINTFTTSAGAVQIYTSSGTALLTSSVHELSYSAGGTLTSDSVYASDGSGSISGIMIDGKDVTASLTGGTIGALVELRDETLPGIQDEIDALSDAVQSAVNAAANAATPVPPPNSLTGSASVAATDAIVGSGTLTVVLTDSDGEVTASADIDLSGCSTMQDVLDELNAVSGISASLDSDGHLVVTATDSDAGVILTGDGTLDGTGFNSAMGMYDILTGSAGTLGVSETLSTQGMAVAAVASTTVGDAAYAVDDTTALQAIYNAMDDSQSFAAAGNLSSTKTSISGYAQMIIDDTADRAETASDTATTSSATSDTLSTSFSNTYGVNVDEETARLTTYQQDYEAAAQILTTAQAMWDSLITMMN
jgi:flagellar hook-associated protein 1